MPCPYLFLLLLLLLLEGLDCFVCPYQLSKVGHILVCLLQQVGEPLVLLLVDQLPVAFLVLGLWGAGCQ